MVEAADAYIRGRLMDMDELFGPVSTNKLRWYGNFSNGWFVDSTRSDHHTLFGAYGEAVLYLIKQFKTFRQ